MSNRLETRQSNYLEFYRYLPVLTAQQIVKLRNVAIGLLQIDAFSEEERKGLECQLVISDH